MNGSIPPIRLTDADSVVEVLRAGARANREAACRQGSIDLIAAPGRLIATGDLHDNPLHFDRLVRLAGLGTGDEPAHLTLHEIVHGERLVNGMDLSYRMLARVAQLKHLFPEHVHVLLGNHELAQASGSLIVKDGVRSVEAFTEGLDYVFGAESGRVGGAVAEFAYSMPLALRARTSRGDILCAHSVPPAALMGRLDTSVLSRELTPDDYAPRRGAAHLMVWGRGYDAEGLEDLTEAWGVYLFVLGHEHAPDGALFVPPNALVLNSDHARGVYLPLDLSDPPRPELAISLVRPLATGG